VRECIASFGPLVWSIARRFRAHDDEAAQLAADMFGALWQQVGRYDPSVASEPVFVTMVARRCAIEQLRASASRPVRRADDALDNADVQDEFERCPEAAIATGVLASLDPRQRRALSLAIGQAMTSAEVAESNDMTPASAKSLLRRAVVAVRKRVQARQGEAP
jgi:RNA polymerase sigma-70 factor (ECF subfamily)